MAILCGVDIVEIDRIKNSFETCGESFGERIFTKNETNYCESRKVAKYESYAARFAAKEAVSKALGTGIGQGIQWKDIEIYNDEYGKPHVKLTAKAEEIFEKAKGKGISISLSHSKQYAVAYVVFET